MITTGTSVSVRVSAAVLGVAGQIDRRPFVHATHAGARGCSGRRCVCCDGGVGGSARRARAHGGRTYLHGRDRAREHPCLGDGGAHACTEPGAELAGDRERVCQRVRMRVCLDLSGGDLLEPAAALAALRRGERGVHSARLGQLRVVPQHRRARLGVAALQRCGRAVRGRALGVAQRRAPGQRRRRRRERRQAGAVRGRVGAEPRKTRESGRVPR
jgi:hypothetical protein